MRIVVFLLILCMPPALHAQETLASPDKFVTVTYAGGAGFALALCGDTSYAYARQAFTARHRNNARLTGVLIPPPGAPSGLQWNWWFDNGLHDMTLHGNGEYTGLVTVAVGGNPLTVPAGTYAGGTMCLVIDFL